MISEKAVEQARADADADARPRIERALSRWDVRLSETQIADLSCQVIEPRTGKHRSTLLYFFGGGFVTGSPENDLSITAALAVLGDKKIIAPRYSLSPENPYPTAISEAFKVYRLLAQEQPLTLCGESAGGGLALAVLHRAAEARISMPSRLALLSPWCDLREEATTRSKTVDDPLLNVEDLRFFAEAYLNNASADEIGASPFLAPISGDWPRTLVTTGSRDRLRHTVHDLCNKIVAAGKECEIDDIPGMHHVFEAYDENAEALVSLKRIAAFLAPGTSSGD